jgi:hypothetical protein
MAVGNVFDFGLTVTHSFEHDSSQKVLDRKRVSEMQITDKFLYFNKHDLNPVKPKCAIGLLVASAITCNPVH